VSGAEPGARRLRPTGVRWRCAALSAGLLAAAVACGGGSADPAQSGVVSGTVFSAPSCPVERAGTPCPPRVVPGAELTVRRGPATVAHVRAGADGRFEVRVEAGRYTIVARAVGGIGSTASAEVTVTAGGTSAVTLTVDSGIR
jgi:Carboxypeptidase regulatory-like domain